MGDAIRNQIEIRACDGVDDYWCVERVIGERVGMCPD